MSYTMFTLVIVSACANRYYIVPPLYQLSPFFRAKKTFFPLFISVCVSHLICPFFFFLNNPAPPKISPFPLPALFPFFSFRFSRGVFSFLPGTSKKKNPGPFPSAPLAEKR